MVSSITGIGVDEPYLELHFQELAAPLLEVFFNSRSLLFLYHS
jgi:hypothetical protein